MTFAFWKFQVERLRVRLALKANKLEIFLTFVMSFSISAISIDERQERAKPQRNGI
jgi:hypothetical protein